MTKAFEGKTVLISGAGRGLGREAALRFGGEGAKLVLNDYDGKTLAATLSDLKDMGLDAVGEAGDVAEEATSKSLVELAETTFGGLHVAINNAGIAQTQMRLHETDSDLAQRIVNVDLMGVFFAMKHQLPVMVEKAQNDGVQRAILNVASVAGIIGAPMIAAYCGAKHGVVGLTRSAAMEYARKNIRINALCPAFTRTNMVTDILDASRHGPDQAEQKLIANNPMGRLGEISEVVQAMVWACHDDNSFYNGQTLAVDGALSA